MARGPITFTSKGDWSKTTDWLKRDNKQVIMDALNKCGEAGVEALKQNTPVDTGRLASSWYYTVEATDKKATITWSNSDIENGLNVALLVEYGHGTKSGYYIEGRDFIRPAIRPIFDQLADTVWKEVTKV